MGKSCAATHPYRGLWAAIATMHGKERVIAPVLCRWFDMALTTVPGIDTDAFGTFSREIARQGTMLEAARAKARLAIERTGAHLGLGSEGAFGPHPHIPFLASGQEVLLLLEAGSGHEIVVSRRTATNFAHTVLSPSDDPLPFLNAIGFTQHAVIVRPEGASDPSALAKGLKTIGAVQSAVWDLARRSSTGRVVLQTEMRAHLNPTRMASIGSATRWLALRIVRCCPVCKKPGFGLVDVERGLLCQDCGMPTQLIKAEIHACMACGHRIRRRERSDRVRSDPTWCDMCNP